MGAKVCRVKPWTKKLVGTKGCREALDGAWHQRCKVEHCTEQLSGAKVCRVKPWTEMCGGCQGLQGQAVVYMRG